MHAAKWTAGLAAALLLSLPGCGGDEVTIVRATGTVMYQGKPVPGAAVVFAPEVGPPATATTDEQGRFELVTRGQPGVAVGSSRVSITALEPLQYELQVDDPDDPAAAEAAMTPEYFEALAARRSLIPQKYARAETSNLTATVAAREENDFLFELTD